MFSAQELLLILVIVLVVFGTKKLRNIGGDLGSAIKNFRQAVRDGENDNEANKTPSNAAINTAPPPPQMTQNDKGQVIEGQVASKQNDKV